MGFRLRWLEATHLPVDGSAIRPDLLAGRRPDDLAGKTVRVGNVAEPLGKLFEISELAGEEAVLILEGDLSHVRDLGAGMTGGRMVVRGDVGPRLAVRMSGGEIEVDGRVGPWAFAEMAGGIARIRGQAGDYLGAALPESRRGMRDGLILVEGSVGEEAGLAMRRGLIAVTGALGGGVGHDLIAGTILGFGPAGRPIGPGMKRGSIVLRDVQGTRAEVFPTFELAGEFRPTWLSLYLQRLKEMGFPVPEGWGDGGWERWNGDLARGGQGEVLIGV